MDILERNNARGYTILQQAGGRGTKTGEPHLGSHAWPSMNSAIMTVVDDSKVANILEQLHQTDIDNPLLGLRAFVWNIEASI